MRCGLRRHGFLDDRVAERRCALRGELRGEHGQAPEGSFLWIGLVLRSLLISMNQAMIRRFAWILPLVTLTACGTLKPHYVFVGAGEVDPGRDHDVVERVKEAHGDTSPPPDVKVLMNTIPEGIDASGMTIKVEADYNHKILGTFQILPQRGMFYFTAWFYDYEDTWRKGVCYWQAPLEWLTLGFWSLVPTSYVCHPSSGYRTKVEVVEDVKRAAAAAGADLVIMNFLGAKDDDAMGATGLLIHMDPRFKAGEIKTKPGEVRTNPVTAP